MRSGGPLTARDRKLLAFIGEHRLVLAAHARALLGGSADALHTRLGSLSDAGYLIEEPVLARQPATYRSTRLGLDAVGSELRPLPVSLAGYWHDVGAAWLWLAAQRGAFGPMREVIAERLLRSHDARENGREDPFGVRLGGLGPKGRERLHYPDLLLVDRSGRRIAIELELTSKGPSRREGILAGYAADARVAKVLYVVYKPQVARALGASVSRLGISSLVRIQRVRPPDREHAAARDTRAITRHTQRPAGELAR